MVAAAVVVVGQWSHIAPVYKLGGIIAVDAAVLALAALMRQASPVVAHALAHLGATMVVPAGVAFVAAAHGTWPAATLFGGACGALACVGQARAWKARWLVVAAEGAAVIGLIGAATLTHIALGYLLAIAAAAALFMRREPTAARFAIATALAPATGIVGSFGIGSGTIVRIGEPDMPSHGRPQSPVSSPVRCC